MNYIKEVKYRTNNNSEKLLIKFRHKKKNFQVNFRTKTFQYSTQKKEIVKDKSFHEEHFSQPLQTNDDQDKKTVSFLTGYSSIFNVAVINNKIYFAKSITYKDGFYPKYDLSKCLQTWIIK